MNSSKTTVTIDGELFLNRIEAIERAINDIRRAAAQGIGQPGSPAGINLHLLDWKIKDSKPASEADPWAWAFAYTRDGDLLDAARQLVQEIQRYGKVEVSGYEVTLGGRDKRLLNRNKIGSQRR